MFWLIKSLHWMINHRRNLSNNLFIGICGCVEIQSPFVLLTIATMVIIFRKFNQLIEHLSCSKLFHKYEINILHLSSNKWVQMYARFWRKCKGCMCVELWLSSVMIISKAPQIIVLEFKGFCFGLIIILKIIYSHLRISCTLLCKRSHVHLPILSVPLLMLKPSWNCLVIFMQGKMVTLAIIVVYILRS